MTEKTLLLSKRSGAPIIARSLGPEDPLAEHRAVVWWDAGRAYAGRAGISGVFECENYPHTEILIVTDGTLQLSFAGQSKTLGTGEAAVIPLGLSVEIDGSDGASCCFFAALPLPEKLQKEQLAPIFMTGDEGLQPSPPPALDALVTPPPTCGTMQCIVDVATGFSAGVWSATPYERQIRPHQKHEMMHVVEGGMTLFDGEGSSFILEKGDTIFVPKGALCGWLSAVPMRKYYAGA
jgi:uncharacterized cupin superfamily protein